MGVLRLLWRVLCVLVPVPYTVYASVVVGTWTPVLVWAVAGQCVQLLLYRSIVPATLVSTYTTYIHYIHTLLTRMQARAMRSTLHYTLYYTTLVQLCLAVPVIQVTRSRLLYLPDSAAVRVCIAGLG